MSQTNSKIEPKLYSLEYDIHNKSMGNPSNALRRAGAIRTTGSVWVLHEDHIPHNLLHRMTLAGVTWTNVPFERGNEAALQRAANGLAKQIADIEASARKSLTNLKRLAEEKPEAERAAYYARRARQIVRNANRAIQQARRAAEIFGLSELATRTTQTASVIETLQQTAHARAAIYAQMTEQVKDTDLHAAAAADEVPAGVLADYIEDQTGRDMSNVHEAFPAPAACQDETPSVSREAWEWRYHAARKEDHVLTQHEMAFYYRDKMSPEDAALTNDAAAKEYAALVG